MICLNNNCIERSLIVLVWEIIWYKQFHHKDKAFGAFQDAFDYVCGQKATKLGGRYENKNLVLKYKMHVLLYH